MAPLRLKRFNQPGREADGNSKWNSASERRTFQEAARRPVMPPLVEPRIASSRKPTAPMIETLLDTLRGRKKSLHTTPDLTLRAVWEDLNTPPARKAGKYHRLFQHHIQAFDAESRESLLSDLLTIEQGSLEANDALGFIRETIMDLTDKKLCAEHLGTLQRRVGDHPADTGDPPPPDVPVFKAAADCTVQIVVLRKFCIRKYGDGGPRGWFAGYRHISRFFHQHMFDGPRRTAMPVALIFEGQPVRPTKEDFQRLRCRLQKAYVGQQFALQIVGAAPEKAVSLAAAMAQAS
jgi:hypothetical protein